MCSVLDQEAQEANTIHLQIDNNITFNMTSSTSLTTICRSQVPDYLHKSELYLSFCEIEDDEGISVPTDCIKLD